MMSAQRRIALQILAIAMLAGLAGPGLSAADEPPEMLMISVYQVKPDMVEEWMDLQRRIASA